jgi:hypothetical protein
VPGQCSTAFGLADLLSTHATAYTNIRVTPASQMVLQQPVHALRPPPDAALKQFGKGGPTDYEGGCSPSSASSTPAFCSCSLYFLMTSIALRSGNVPASCIQFRVTQLCISLPGRAQDVLVATTILPWTDFSGTELVCRDDRNDGGSPLRGAAAAHARLTERS